MRCNKCGSFIDDDQNVCPICGMRVNVYDKSEVIQAEIGNKIDQFLSDKDGRLNNSADGVDIRDGHMQVSERPGITDTKKFAANDSDSVFRAGLVTAGKQQPGDDDGLNDEELNELLGAGIVRDEPEDDIEDWDPAGDGDDEDGGKHRLSGGVIAAIIIAGVVVITIIILIASGVAGRILKPELETESVSETESQTETTPVSDTLTASVESGSTQTAPFTVKLESALGGSIYYTLDGTEPTRFSKRYTGQIRLTDSNVDAEKGESEIVIRAASFTPGAVQMGELEVRFTLKIPVVEAPSFSLESGKYSSAQTITITAAEGAVIYYTYDGSTPTEDSAEYTGPIQMKRGNNILSAIAVSGSRQSEVTQAVYDLTIPAAFDYAEAQRILEEYLRDKDILPESEMPKKDKPSQPSEEETESSSDESSETGESDPETEIETETGKETEDTHLYCLLTSAGTEIIDQRQYYVFTADIMNSDGILEVTRYYGVDDQNGAVVTLQRDGSDFYFD